MYTDVIMPESLYGNAMIVVYIVLYSRIWVLTNASLNPTEECWSVANADMEKHLIETPRDAVSNDIVRHYLTEP